MKFMLVENEQKLQEIFKIVLELDEATDVSSVRQLSKPNWDSLAQSSLVSAIEAEFALRFKMSEMFQITSFQAARALLEEKGL